jgi:phage tail-like protein
MPSSAFDNSHSAFFLVEVDGVDIGTFREVSGLEVTVATEDIEEGGVNGYVHKLPGRMTWPNLVLKRGVTSNDNLLAWLGEVSGSGFAKAGNSLTRKTAAIILLSPEGNELRRWNFIDVIPVRWSGPTFAAEGAQALVEELEMAHHGFTADG